MLFFHSVFDPNNYHLFPAIRRSQADPAARTIFSKYGKYQFNKYLNFICFEYLNLFVFFSLTIYLFSVEVFKPEEALRIKEANSKY